MMNQAVIVGRITEQPKIEDNKCMFTVAVNRSFKNADGIYETDFIKCITSGVVATNMCDYCQKGDIIGVKGRIETNNVIVAEKITFLSSKKSSEE